MILRNFLMVGLALATLTACASKPASDLYVLRVPENAPIDRCTSSTALVIDRPTAAKEYDNKRIAVMLDHNHLSYYTGASWASPFPDQLQDFLSDAFARQGLNVVDGTAPDASGASVLHLTIHEADVVDVNAPVVHLRLTGNIASPDGRTLRINVNRMIPAADNHMSQIIDAYDQAALDTMGIISTARETAKYKGGYVRCSGT